MQIIHYLAADNTDCYQEWLDRLRDLKTRVMIQRRVDRLMNGNFGDHRFCRDGVWELRIDMGPGYRVTTRVRGKPSCCCSAAVISVPKMPTSTGLSPTGKIISGDDHER